MRPDGPDNQIDLNFDCSASPTGFKRTDIPVMTYVRLEAASGTVSRTATGYINVPTGMNLLCVNTKGTLIARAGEQERHVLIPPRSLTLRQRHEAHSASRSRRAQFSAAFVARRGNATAR